MRINIDIPSIKCTVTDADGTLILNYEVSNYKLMADAKGLIKAGLDFKAALEDALDQIDPSVIERALDPNTVSPPAADVIDLDERRSQARDCPSDQ